MVPIMTAAMSTVATRGTPKILERRSHADKLRDHGEPIQQHKVQKRKPSPKRSESVKNGLRMTPFGHRAKSYRHFLHVVSDRPQQDQKPDQMKAYFAPVAV